MSDSTQHLSLPLLAAGQAQKHVTVNEALVALDALVQLSVQERRAAPPASPAEGQRFIVESGATGDFAGQAGAIAQWSDGAWLFFVPQAGWIAWVATESAPAVYDGAQWEALQVSTAERLGIGATADADNRLAVASPAVLFTHAGSDSRLKLNKAALADTASLVFQHGFSGRAEMGLAGNDAFALKVSTDGATWREALVSGTDGSLQAPGGMRLPDGAKIANEGTASTSGLELEGGGSLGRVGLVIKSVVGLTGALFEQRAPAGSSVDVIDFGFKTLTQQMNQRVESRLASTRTGATPEFQVGDRTGSSLVVLLAVSARQTLVQSPLGLKPHALADLPAAATVRAGALVYVDNATGGGVPAFSDGTAWRRVTDRSVVD